MPIIDQILLPTRTLRAYRAAATTLISETMLVVNSRIQIPTSELQFTYSRSSGPGGQNVNKVNSKATLRWHVVDSPSLPGDVKTRFLNAYGSRMTADGELVISSQRYRDQGRNVGDCLEKVRMMLKAVASAPRKRKPTRPTRSSVKKRRIAKQQLSDRKQSRRTMPQSDA